MAARGRGKAKCVEATVCALNNVLYLDLDPLGPLPTSQLK